MNILVLNGSPKGKNSITLQTVLYLQKLAPQHHFEILHIGQRIKYYEKDFIDIKYYLETTDLILFVYPVYTFIAPYQVHRFMELIKENNVNIDNKFVSQITTSKHFYDTTAHKFIEENCYDLGLKYIRGLSADMEDLLTAKGQKEARSYFNHLMFSIEHDLYQSKKTQSIAPLGKNIQMTAPLHTIQKDNPKRFNYDVVIVSCYTSEDKSLKTMISNFRHLLPCPSREVNLMNFSFAGGCLGCLNCASTGKCIYKDGFDDFLRNEIQTADAIIYAFPIKDHYAPSVFKNYDDRQFCNGHRTVTEGTPVGYLISGNLENEHNLQTILEARSEVGKNFLAGIVTDEHDTNEAIKKMAMNLIYALKHKCRRPQNFYGVGGSKIFRDLIYLMRGMMKADHEYYKSHGEYDFPQKQPGKILMMKMVGHMLSIPSLQKEMKGKINQYMLMPYQKVIDSIQPPNSEI